MEQRISRHMAAVEQYSQALHGLQGIWDNLALLGHLSGTGTDMSATRSAFQALTTHLLEHLSAETLKKSVLELKAKAQVAVDIMVRNLYERTADIGFLASDEAIRRFLLEEPALSRAAASFQDNAEEARASLRRNREALRRRFREYVEKYSVYRDIILLDPDGRVVLQLDDSHPLERSDDPLIGESLRSSGAYVETFRASDLLPGGRRGLVYSWRVSEGERPLGVLCLCFRFENETEGIFANLREEGDWSTLMLLDAEGRVIASGDPWHVPVDAPMELALEEQGRLVRFAGREYLSITRRTKGYQGYMGPGWYGHAMIPIQHAFDKDASRMLRNVPEQVLAEVRENPTIFSEALRSIPAQAESIQRELNRSVWNGNVHQSGRQTTNASFSKVLLWEISNTGARTKAVFERSIANLHETVVSAILQDSRFLASLAADIMDRNLYERANDCRWWALDTTLAHYLEGQGGDAEAVTEILRQINGLYTVYENIVLFDAQGRVRAVSNADYQSLVGSVLGDEWVRRVLALPDSASYHVSDFARASLYRDRHTYVYGAALRATEHARVVGGIAIVFDAQPQFAAMLRDALPRDEKGDIVPGCFGLFVDRQQQVIAASARHQPGDRLNLPPEFFSPRPEGMANIVALDGHYYAVGARASRGYREYPGVGAIAMVFVPLGPLSQAQRRAVPKSRPHARHGQQSGEVLDVATFSIGDNWFGLLSEHVVEAIDCQCRVKVPGAPHYVVGYVMWNGSPIVVVDIGRLISPEVVTQGKDVIVVRENERAEPFGILVESLDEIPEIARARLDTVSSSLAGTQVLLDALVRPLQNTEPILPILGPARIRDRIARLSLGGR